MQDIGLIPYAAFVTSILLVSLSIVIFYGTNKFTSRAFGINCILVAIWVMTLGIMQLRLNYNAILFFTRLSYYLGTCIALSFYYFLFHYPVKKSGGNLPFIILFSVQLLSLYLYLFTNKIIYSVTGQSYSNWTFGEWSMIFEATFFIIFAVGIYNLNSKIKDSSPIEIVNLKYMLTIIIVGLIPPSIFSIVFPRLGIFSLNGLGAISEILWIPIIIYSFIKHGHMNIKIFFSEMMAIGVTVIFFVDILLKIEPGLWMRSILIVTFIILAHFLIKTSINESKQKNELSELNRCLEQRVTSQTQEISKAYLLEKKARRDLEKLNEMKDQFIVITQHHLRSPVNIIKTEVQSIASNNLSKDLKNKLINISKSTDKLLELLANFISIKAVQVGSPLLNFSKINLRILVDDILQEIKSEIDAKSITIDVRGFKNETIEADKDKLREALLVIIENAIKYNYVNGFVDIIESRSEIEVALTIKNSGIGITKGEKEKMFSGVFYRGERARKNNPIGMGVGLSVANSFIKAHNGSLNINSLGENLGAETLITLPINQNL